MRAAARPSNVVFGCAGYQLSEAERRFFRETRPLGFILYDRNCGTPGQVRDLVADLRESVGRADVDIFIDQEGGRVARLAPPHWRQVPAAAQFLNLARSDPRRAAEAVRLNARLIAADLRSLGITVNIAPVLDLPAPNAHKIIGDRAFGSTPAMVSLLGRAACEGLIHGAVLPVIKHILGHGRAAVDRDEPWLVVDASMSEMDAFDFVPFRALQDMPWAMAAHVLYRKLDPEVRATASAPVIEGVIRNRIGFGGVLLTDDVATLGPVRDLARHVRETIEAGCDIVMHGTGDMEEMQAVASALEPVGEATLERINRAGAMRREPEPFDAARATARLDILLRIGRHDEPDGPKTRSAKVVSEVVEKVEHDIAFGRLLPRQRLMEDELVYGMGVKRHVARAAFQELARRGMVTVEPYRGAAVRYMSADELAKLEDLQVMLHRAAAERITLPVSEHLVARLEEAQREFLEASTLGDVQLLSDADMVFHDLLIEGTSNEFLVASVRSCDALTRSVHVPALCREELVRDFGRDHDAIIAALRAGDRAGVAMLLEAHLGASFRHYRSMFLDRLASGRPTRH